MSVDSVHVQFKFHNSLFSRMSQFTLDVQENRCSGFWTWFHCNHVQNPEHFLLWTCEKMKKMATCQKKHVHVHVQPVAKRPYCVNCELCHNWRSVSCGCFGSHVSARWYATVHCHTLRLDMLLLQIEKKYVLSGREVVFDRKECRNALLKWNAFLSETCAASLPMLVEFLFKKWTL